MSRMLAIAALLGQHRGLTVPEIAEALGDTSTAGRNRVSAALCTMALSKRAKHDDKPRGRRKWYATELALIDRRKRGDKPIKPPRTNQIKPPKPPASAGMTIIAKRAEPIVAHREPPETVEQWMARTGERPEVLSPYASSKPLKYDHAEAVAKRRGIAHHVRQGAP